MCAAGKGRKGLCTGLEQVDTSVVFLPHCPLSMHLVELAEREGEQYCPSPPQGGSLGRLSHHPLLPPTDKATNPLNKDLDWDGINAFCEQLNKELEG